MIYEDAVEALDSVIFSGSLTCSPFLPDAPSNPRGPGNPCRDTDTYFRNYHLVSTCNNLKIDASKIEMKDGDVHHSTQHNNTQY